MQVGLGVIERQVQEFDCIGILEDAGGGIAMRLCHRW
jgi:hypothetical protein